MENHITTLWLVMVVVVVVMGIKWIARTPGLEEALW